MVEPYKHKLGELGPEHFDGDPIDRPLSEGARMQAEALVNEVLAGLPKNAVQKPINRKQNREQKE